MDISTAALADLFRMMSVFVKKPRLGSEILGRLTGFTAEFVKLLSYIKARLEGNLNKTYPSGFLRSLMIHLLSYNDLHCE